MGNRANGHRGQSGLWIGGLTGIVLWGCEPQSQRDEPVPLRSTRGQQEAVHETEQNIRNGEASERAEPGIVRFAEPAGAAAESEETPAVRTGSGTKVDCPIAVIDVEGATRVEPQTLLVLRGDGSHSPHGAVSTFLWSVHQPTGSFSPLIEGSGSSVVNLEANVAGDYLFHLDVIDETGKAGCETATTRVRVLPSPAIHVELLWDTPGDADPTDEGPEAGADLDLHVAHPLAGFPEDSEGESTPWFAAVHDCFWFNPNPDWGANGPANSPSLDRDDTDGTGPENFNLKIPEEDTLYRVGAHYWNDHNYGDSEATIRIYIEGELRYEKSLFLQNGDFWDIATIFWPAGEVVPIGDGEVVLPDFPDSGVFAFP